MDQLRKILSKHLSKLDVYIIRVKTFAGGNVMPCAIQTVKVVIRFFTDIVNS